MIQRFLRLSCLVAAAAALSIALPGCTNSSAAPSTFAPFSQTDLVTGTGATAAAGTSLTVEYTGWLYDPAAVDTKGLRFDSSAGRGPFTFTLGAGQVIQGWDVGLIGMQVGGTRRLVIPPSLAYGDSRSGIIPPSATLVFDVQLVSVTGP